MEAHGLERRWRLLAASFMDGRRGGVYREQLGEKGLREAMEILLLVMGRDLAVPPADLDRQHVAEVMRRLLPGRLSGEETYASLMPDLLEEWLLHACREEGLATAWEWTSAVDETREDFRSALADDRRPILAPPKRSPDRRPAEKIGRNAPCPCGSGRKYKHCCLRLL